MQFELNGHAMLTPGEADWMQERFDSLGGRNSSVGRLAAALTLRILRARLSVVADHIEPDHIPHPDTITRFWQSQATGQAPDFRAKLTFHSQMQEVRRIERQLGVDESGAEKHIIRAVFNPHEERLLYALARIMNAGAMHDATQNYPPTPDADPVYAPLIEDMRSDDFHEDLQTLSVTRGIMSAIEKHIELN